MSWKVGLLLGLMACGAETQTPKSQDLGGFESWGSGIEDFEVAPVTEDGTGGEQTADATYDGSYVGTFSMTLSYNGYVCTFSNVTLGVTIDDGLLDTPFTPIVSQECSFGTTNTYSPQFYFGGTVGSDATVSGLFSEGYAFNFEGAWTGSILDLGNGSYQLISEDFNQEVSAFFPGDPTLVSGSFILTKQ